jgi:hypothetical protein
MSQNNVEHDYQLYTPRINWDLRDGEVFVFGSNTLGRHGRGAALYAFNHAKAKLGVGEGIEGNSYAIPTKIGTYNRETRRYHLEIAGIDFIREKVNTFIDYVLSHDDRIYYVTLLGCGYAHYSPVQIGPLFKKLAGHPKVYLPAEFVGAIRGGIL